MSLKKNILANYASQVYGTLVAIVIVPVYIRYMGEETYGLVGFFAVLQVWFNLLDAGMTATMTRETARFRGGAIGVPQLRRLLRALEGIFFCVGAAGAASIVLGADAIAGKWLQAQQLPLDDVKHAVMLMGMIVSFRWISGMYRGTISGFERLVWLSNFNIAIATVRFMLVLPYLVYVGTSATDFFVFQLVVAVIELGVLVRKTYSFLPATENGSRISWEWAPLQGVLRFSLNVAFTNAIWVLITQMDKLLLSALLPLADYGVFTLAVMVASGVTVISSPISMALQPRLAKLSAEGNEAELIGLYRNATQLVSVIAIPAALMLAFFAEQILWAWTGNADIARRAAPVLMLYALGNGVLALGAFPYYLQFAKGDLRLHVIGNIFFSLLLIPGLIWAAKRYGAVGAGYAWLTLNLAFFLLWTPKVHARFVKGLHFQWLTRDVGGIALTAVAGVELAYWFVQWPRERGAIAVEVVMLSLGLLAVAAAGSPWVRTVVIGKTGRA